MQRYNILTEVKSLVDNAVLLEAEGIIEAYKPAGVFVTEDSWQQATSETRQLLSEVAALTDRLLPAFRHCCSIGNWRLALDLYMKFVNAPDSLCLSSVLNTPDEIKEKESTFISDAHSWIEETNELLEEAELNQC